MIADTDLYVSRANAHPQIIERQDPVVYGSHGPLGADQIQSYDQKGYLYLDSFFTPDEVNVMRKEKDLLWQRSQSENRPEVIREMDSQIVRSVFAVHRDIPYFRELAQNPRLLAIARQILGRDVYITQSRINYKTGFAGKEFFWHSDFETWHVEDGMPRMRAFSMSIALTPNYPYNGPVMVIPGSHRYFVSCTGKTPEHHYQQSLRKQVYGTPDPDSLNWLIEKCGPIEMPTGPAGSLLIFDCNIMHGSNSNISPFPRSNIFLVYNSVENRLKDPYSGLPPRPDYIAARD